MQDSSYARGSLGVLGRFTHNTSTHPKTNRRAASNHGIISSKAGYYACIAYQETCECGLPAEDANAPGGADPIVVEVHRGRMAVGDLADDLLLLLFLLFLLLLLLFLLLDLDLDVLLLNAAATAGRLGAMRVRIAALQQESSTVLPQSSGEEATRCGLPYPTLPAA